VKTELHYSGMNDPDQWVFPRVLEEQARRQPDATWFQSTEGESLTFGEAARDAQQVAGYFASLGINPGDRIAVMLPNCADFVRVWTGLGRLGAVEVLLNTELRGPFLEHQLRNCGAELAVIDPAYGAILAEVAPRVPTLKRVILTGSEPGGSGLPGPMDLAEWRTAGAWDGPMPRSHDIACIMYTSGTSGPAKGVLMPHAHSTLFGIGAVRCLELGPADKYYIVLPLFHANGLLIQLGSSLLAGIPAVVRPRFSASAWLSDLRTFRPTVTNTLGAIAAFIVAQPATPEDRDHCLRAVINVPNVQAHEAIFRERYGVKDVVSAYGMTEVNIPIWGKLGRSVPGAAGWVPAEHFEMVIADAETDRPLKPGEVGEILVRPKVAFGFMAGYYAMPEKTVEAWRNLWFHTGDAGMMDESGLLTFVDRIKDCIRRRGENISAAEVEEAIAPLDGIAEIAACAVPSDIKGGEDEILLSVVLAPGASLTPQAIVEYADRVLPRFARPRYVRLLAELPHTATGKVQRAVLRQPGSEGAWDRQAASGGSA